MKLYVVNGKRCIAKAKTVPARKTLDPFYQQSLTFKDNCRGCILQVRDTNTENRFSLRLVLFFFSFFFNEIEQTVAQPTRRVAFFTNNRETFDACFQVTVWGDYGRLEGKKVFMGIAQIVLDELNLNDPVIGWYKLFGTTSLVSGPPSLALSRRSSATSLDSFKI